MCILCHLPKFGFGANMGFGDMVNQTMPIGSTGTHYMDKMLTIRYVAPSLDSI